MILWILGIAFAFVVGAAWGYCHGKDSGLNAWKQHEAKELERMATELARLFREKVKKWPS